MFQRKSGFLKNLLCGLVLTSLAVTMLAGCGESGALPPDKKTIDSIVAESYEVSWYIDGGGAQNDVGLIEKEFNRYMKEEKNSNLTIKLVEYDWGSYVQKMNAMMMSGEKFDLCFAVDWALPHTTNIMSGVWLPWDEYINLIPEYGLMVQPYLDRIKNIGTDGVERNYLMPTIKEFASQSGIVFNKTAADDLGITEQLYKVKNLDELPELFDIYKAKYPQGAPFIATSSALYTYYGHGFTHGLWFNNDEEKYVLGCETPIFDEYLARNRDWYQRGYIPDFELTTLNKDLFNRTGKMSFLAWYSTVKPGFEEERNPTNLIDYGWEYGTTPITQPTMTRNSILGNATALSSTSKNPMAAAYLYELICTDAYLTNLINFGIEGIHHTMDDEGFISPVENSQYWPGINYYLGNRYLDHPIKGEPKNLAELYNNFNNSAIALKNDGFVVNEEKYDLTLFRTVNSSINSQYQVMMQCGTMTDADLTEMRNKYKEAKVDEVLKYYNEQYQEWKASKKK